MLASSLARPVSLSPQPTEARRQVTNLLVDAGWPGDVHAVLLALHEAMVNSHGHGGGVSQATASVDGDALVIEVRDRGRGFVLPTTQSLPDPAAETGRGLFLIRRLATEADVRRIGDEVCLVMHFEG
jgi:anti-sigma regulatory factor (Ser/Thr protein kinase)